MAAIASSGHYTGLTYTPHPCPVPQRQDHLGLGLEGYLGWQARLAPMLRGRRPALGYGQGHGHWPGDLWIGVTADRRARTGADEAV